MTDFVDWNVKNGQQGTSLLPVGFSEELIAVFKMKKNRKLPPNLTKNPKFSSFQSFYAIFVKFSIDFVDWNDGMLKTVIKVRICCPVVSYEEITVVFKLKKSQIGTEIDKKPKILQFLKFLYAIFVKFNICIPKFMSN